MSNAETRLSIIGILPGAVIGLVVKKYKGTQSNNPIIAGALIGSVTGFLAAVALEDMLSKLE